MPSEYEEGGGGLRMHFPRSQKDPSGGIVKYTFFLIKNTLNKNSEAYIARKIRTIWGWNENLKKKEKIAKWA